MKSGYVSQGGGDGEDDRTRVWMRRLRNLETPWIQFPAARDYVEIMTKVPSPFTFLSFELGTFGFFLPLVRYTLLYDVLAKNNTIKKSIYLKSLLLNYFNLKENIR